MNLRYPLLILSLLLCAAPRGNAQIQVELKVPHRPFIAYEPVIVTVSITNLAGRDVTLRDADSQKWFGFQIKTGDDHIVTPRNPDYQLQPMDIPAGKTIRRSIDLNSLFPVNELGTYRVKASIYFADMQKYFDSPVSNFDVDDGKTIWEQTVGIPGDKTEYRTMSLLIHHLSSESVLYVRVEDKDKGVMYGTMKLGRIIFGNNPEALLDKNNELHVLQMSAPKSYIYTKIGPSAEWNGQVAYTAVATKPDLHKVTDGSVTIRGGQVEAPPALTTGTSGPPKLSDRPPGMPAH